MQLVQIKNQREYLELIKFLYEKKKFGCVEDWDYFFSLDIFTRKENEKFQAYLTRLDKLESKSSEQVVKEFNNLNAAGIPKDNLFPCLILFDMHSEHDALGRVELQVFQMFPEKHARTLRDLMSKSPPKKQHRNRKTNERKNKNGT